LIARLVSGHVRAVTVDHPGGPEVLRLIEVPDPVARRGEVLIDIAAAAVNHADLVQRRGLYDPPEGAPPWPGLECSGTVAATGEGVSDWQIGDQVCALLAGGGYAERVAVLAGQVLPVPDGIPLVHAAALPEAACTIWSNLFMLAALRPGETILVHGGAGGMGSFAVQLAAHVGARVFTTAGSGEKLERCRALGAEITINYKNEDFVDVVREATGGRGVDVILDNMGAAYLSRNLEALAFNGRLVVIGLQGGRKAEIDLGKLSMKRAAILATTLRHRPAREKAAIVRSVRDHVWPLLIDGRIKPVVDRVLPLAAAAEAHRIMEAGQHIGKIVLAV
jgi:putative PIG3 family NAD(P)H quinone oxidoreductase